MCSRELKKMLAHASKLAPTQRQELIRALSDVDEAGRVVQTVQSRPQVCPQNSSACLFKWARKSEAAGGAKMLRGKVLHRPQGQPRHLNHLAQVKLLHEQPSA